MRTIVTIKPPAWPVVGLLAVALVSCDGGGPPVDTLAGRKRELLASVATRAVLPSLRAFSTSAGALVTATDAHAADPTDATRDAAREAFVTTVLDWERLELMQLGPAGMSGTLGVTGGMDLRDEIYSWPLTSTCRIDQETLAPSHADPDLLADELVDTRGLDALEYLLFAESDANTCPAASPVQPEWDAAVAEIPARRAAYAHAAAVLVSRQADALLAAWEGGFADELGTAGDTSTVYASAQGALDDLASALLYLDIETRDMKIGEPAGISAGCPTATCPEALELPRAVASREAIAENLRGFALLVHGGEPDDPAAVGIVDLLIDVGQDALAADLAAAIEAAIVAVDAIPVSLESAIEADPAAVMAAWEAVGLAQRLFKVDVVTALDLEPSAGRVGDND